jgi:hypothetical protein
MVHADDEGLHTRTVAASQKFVQEHGMTRTAHPRHSLNLAPSDFYFFCHMKRCLTEGSFEKPNQLLLCIGAVSGFVGESALNEVFLDSIHRLRQCIAVTGDDFE